MPDKRIIDLDPIVTVQPTTVLVVVDDPTGSAIDKKATVNQLPIADAQLTANIPKLNAASQTFTGSMNVNGALAVSAIHVVNATTLDNPLSVPSGGTGLAAVTSGGVLACTGPSTVASSPVLPSGYTVVGGGAGAVPHAVASGATVVVFLADVASQTIDATQGTVFSLTTTSGGTRTISQVLNYIAGQKIIIEFYASGAQATLSLPGGGGGHFNFGTDIPALTPTPAGHIDYIGCVCSPIIGVYNVVGYTRI